MVEEGAKAGARVLSERKCTVAVGEVRGETFVKLTEVLIGLVLMYGAEVWGGGGQLGPVEAVQMQAARVFLGVGRLHPLVSLQYELNMMPLRWKEMRWCIEFWVTVLRLNEDRLLKAVMLETLEGGSNFRWIQNLKQSLEMFVWMRGVLCGRHPRFLYGGSEEGSDRCSLERGKGWMEEGGTQAP